MSLRERVESWAERSRLNPFRLLTLPHPHLDDATVAAFDELLDATPDGAFVEYRLPQPKWWFLHRAVQRGYLLHGTNETAIAEFRTRQTFDAYDRPVDAVFASDDAVWPMYFAVVNRAGIDYGYINWCVHARGTSRYVFSIGGDPRAAGSWTQGVVYLLPRATFRETPASRELVSERPVRPRAKLVVAPADFPFKEQTLGHGAGDTPNRVVLRNALSSRRPR